MSYITYPDGGSSGQALTWGLHGTSSWTTISGGGGSGSVNPVQALNYVSSASGSVQMANPATSPYETWNWFVLTGNVIIQAPALTAASVGIATCSLWIDQTGSNTYTVTWNGSPSIRWPGGTAPTQPGGGQRLWCSFACDGTEWCGLEVVAAF